MGQVAEPSKLPARPQQPLGLAPITSTDSNNWEVRRCKGTSAASLTQALIQVSDQQHCLSQAVSPVWGMNLLLAQEWVTNHYHLFLLLVALFSFWGTHLSNFTNLSSIPVHHLNESGIQEMAATVCLYSL